MRRDDLIPAGEGRGIDVALQRADDLDNESLQFIQDTLEKQNTVKALDVACGSGGHSVRMAITGADVTASDILNRADDIKTHAEAFKVDEKVTFKMADMQKLSQHFNAEYDLIVCQRAIHYLPYSQALTALKEMKKVLNKGGKLYISASGLYSELSKGYWAKENPIEERFSLLEEGMAKHHDILHPVCLYNESDLAKALEKTGFKVEKIFSSSFGNIKAIAIK